MGAPTLTVGAHPSVRPAFPPRAGAAGHAACAGQGHRQHSKVAMWIPAFWTPVRALVRWPVTTQVGARRNALVASTALTRRRRERDEVELFLRGLNQAEPQSQAASRT